MIFAKTYPDLFVCLFVALCKLSLLICCLIIIFLKFNDLTDVRAKNDLLDV